jgi:hypothetical protein
MVALLNISDQGDRMGWFFIRSQCSTFTHSISEMARSMWEVPKRLDARMRFALNGPIVLLCGSRELTGDLLWSPQVGTMQKVNQRGSEGGSQSPPYSMDDGLLYPG